MKHTVIHLYEYKKNCILQLGKLKNLTDILINILLVHWRLSSALLLILSNSTLTGVLYMQTTACSEPYFYDSIGMIMHSSNLWQYSGVQHLSYVWIYKPALNILTYIQLFNNRGQTELSKLCFIKFNHCEKYFFKKKIHGTIGEDCKTQHIIYKEK